MKSKAPLVLMEQMVMLLVFALASALCLQAFVKSDDLSQRSAARDRAAVEAQNAAETLRSQSGDMGNALTRTAEALNGEYTQGLLWLDYDENWTPIDYDTCGMEAPAAAYRLEAQGVPADVPGLQTASVTVENIEDPASPDVLFSLNVSWQEVNGRG